MSGRKSLAARVYERAWAIHRRRCATRVALCAGPARRELEQATREILRSERTTA